MAAYAAWSVRASNAWAGLASALKDEDRDRRRASAARRLDACALRRASRSGGSRSMQRLHNQPDMIDVPLLRCSITPRPGSCCPTSARRSSGGIYCPLDGHVNSLQPVPRAARGARSARRASIARTVRSTTIAARRRRVHAVAAHGASSAPKKSCSPPASAMHGSAPHGRARGAGAAAARPDHRHREGAAVPALSRRHRAPDRRRRRDDRRQPRRRPASTAS